MNNKFARYTNFSNTLFLRSNETRLRLNNATAAKEKLNCHLFFCAKNDFALEWRVLVSFSNWIYLFFRLLEKLEKAVGLLIPPSV
jgi:hypothetical protein